MADLKCTDNLTLNFSASYVIPALYNLTDADQFSIAISTDGLIIYKDVIDYPVDSIAGPCETTVNNVNVKLGQVKVSGVIAYRVAAHGIQSDPIIIPDELKDNVNVGENIWSSADGFVEITDGENNYMTVGFILPDEDIIPEVLNVTLKSLKLGSTYEEEQSKDRVVTLLGQFELTYGLA